jgi:hypothetical protein
VTQVVLAYRDQYRVEQPIGRLKGQPLSLRPVYLSRDDHVTGLSAGQPGRGTRRPTAERVLEAFRNVTLTVVDVPPQIIHHLTPLTSLQQRLLALTGLEDTCYLRLAEHSSEPPG